MIDYRVHKTVRIGKNVVLSAFVVVDAGAEIGDDVIIGPGAYIAPAIKIGNEATIGAHAKVLIDVPAGKRVGIGEMWTNKAEPALDENAIVEKVIERLGRTAQARKVKP